MALGLTAQKTLDKKVIGDEPKSGSILNTNTKLIDALNYYNYIYNRKEAIEFLHEYLSTTDKDSLKKIKKVADIKIPTTLGWISRMLTRECVLPDATHDFFRRNVKLAIDKHIEPVVVAAPKKELKPVFEFSYIAELENEIDIFLDNDYTTEFRFNAWVQKNTLPLHAINNIGAYYRPLLAELEAIQKDKGVKEGFRHMTVKQRNSYIDFIKTFIVGTESIIDNRRRTRKPRKVKIENVIKGLKFQAEEKSLNIVSIAPAKIVGASQLVTFNTKTRKLAIYIAEKDKTLTIKGSTLFNVDLKTSKERTIRKPFEVMPKVSNAGKRELNKIFRELTTTESVIENGRINKNHVLLMIF
jgi:hypothetical protein